MLHLAIDEVNHGLCPHPGCGTYRDDRCRICAPPHLCEAHSPARDDQRHEKWCGAIRHQRAMYEIRSQEADQPVQTRGGVRGDLADLTYALVDMLLQAFYPGPLPAFIFSDISKLLNYQKIRWFWSDDYARLATPALYISQNKDQEAYVRTILISGLEPSHRAFGSPPRVNEHQIARYSMLQDVRTRVPADRWAFRVPLALIKLRLVLDLRYLVRNPQRLADLRTSRPRRRLCLKEGGPTRSHMERLVRSDNLARCITRLENEIRTLAEFPHSACFWGYMCYPQDCAWRRRNGIRGIPASMWTCVHLNHYSWVGTPGACEAMIDLLRLSEFLY